MCQLSECMTINSKNCIFPFKFQGKTYDACIETPDMDEPWCSTRTDDLGAHIVGSEEICSANCKVNNCPIGYYVLSPDTTCYMV